MRELSNRVQYFLGANSAGGFVSLYDEWVTESGLQAFYVLKGGAGCGKSTLMRAVARRMEEEGYTVEYIRCSGDPDSLDGIFIPGKGAAVADGTSPHRLDPTYPGAVGHYLNLGEGYDRKELFSRRQEIIGAVQTYKACYPEAYHALREAEESRERGWRALRTEVTLAKVEKRAAGILAREGKRLRAEPGRRIRRFLGGPTCQGRVLLKDTLSLLCQRGYEIRDDCGLAGDFLKYLERAFLERGYDVISCPCPEQPSRLEHLLVPACGLGFVTGCDLGPDFRTIRTESLVEKQAWQQGRRLLRMANRAAEGYAAEAAAHLARAKAHHDQLEELYRPCLDFSCAEELSQRTIREILALPDQTV